MGKRGTYQKMTKDDLRATRVLALAVKFFGSSTPIATSDIHQELYPGLDIKSFNRQFLRDRDLLATLGIVIRPVSESVETMWCVDEASSYIQGEDLSASDARMLYILCYDMAFDQAFPYRDELRIALAKISRMYRGTVIAMNDKTSASGHKLLSALVFCMSARHLAEVTYTNAQGSTRKRTLALLGSFGLRDNTYFIASTAHQDGTFVPKTIKTYRLDRFSQVRELPKVTYQIPPDFSVSDYERLPFQMGDSCGLARFRVTEDADAQITRIMELHGSAGDGSLEQGLVWEVPYSSLGDAASWAVASNVTPLEPAELVEAYHGIMSAAAHTSFDPRLAEHVHKAAPVAPSKPTGRVGSIAITRQLMALATSLTREGEVITADDVAAALGIDYETARHLIMLVSMSSGESIDYLPVILSDESDEVSLMEGARMSARRVRLTRSETIALQAALTQLGVAQDDPLAKTLMRSYASPLISVDEIRRTIEAPSSSVDHILLRQCSRAISEGQGISFSYHPITGGRPSRRRVIPRMLRRSDDNWYLYADDLVRCAERTFRFDRISALETFVPSSREIARGQKRSSEATMITVQFLEPHYLDLFYWEDMQLLARSADGALARMPYYGGMWLVRHLAACAGTVRIDNQALAQRVQEMALTQANQ